MRAFFIPVLLLAVAGCSSTSTSGAGSSSGGGTTGSPAVDAGPTDAGPLDAGPTDGGATDAGPTDAGPSSNAPCTFNSDCIPAERCECDEATGCFCHLGVRGSGAAGVDACDSGNDCASSLCVEGNGGFYCSGPCTGPSDCGPRLPICETVFDLGEICVRNPDGG